MDHAQDARQNLQSQITELEAKLAALRQQLQDLELQESSTAQKRFDERDALRLGERRKPPLQKAPCVAHKSTPLSLEEYARYGRQMIVPGVGLEANKDDEAGQVKLKRASVLIVGVGGLGCPAAAYLAAAGVGTIGLVDGDFVEESNLHRQILHTSQSVGMKKVDSAIRSLLQLNPLVRYNPHYGRLSAGAALDVVSGYDIVLDCTDNPSSRYLISDVAVLLKKRLVSASALGLEGQLMVLNDPPLMAGDQSGGPCYRCIFPKPPLAASVVSCDEGGILGPVVGLMGVYQALEAIRLITGGLDPEEPRPLPDTPRAQQPTLLMFSALGAPPFRSVRLRRRREGCISCSARAAITKSTLRAGLLDYAEFCGARLPVDVLHPEERISVQEFSDIVGRGRARVVIDVREKALFSTCHLEGSINIPMSDIQSDFESVGGPGDELRRALDDTPSETPIYFICRLGNDSQLAVRSFKRAGWEASGKRSIKDIRGGFRAWKDEIDQCWPYV